MDKKETIRARETGVWMPQNSADALPYKNNCYGREYCNKHKIFNWSSAFLLSLLIILILIFGVSVNHNLETYKYEIIDLKRNLKTVQMECDIHVNRFKLKLKSIEEHIDQMKYQHENGKEVTKCNNSMKHDTSTRETEDLLPLIDLSDSANRLNLTDYILQFNITMNEDFENVTLQDLLNDTTGSQPNRKICNMLSMLDEPIIEEYAEYCEELDYRTGRTKRSNPRGKQNGRKSSTRHRDRPHNRSNIRGPVASHFKGAIPETFIQDTGLVAPWYPDEKASAAFSLKYEFRQGQGTVEIKEEGLYLIYGQVYYLTSNPLNSFVINVKDKDSKIKPVAYCSANAVVPERGVTEVSCYTAVIRYLNATNQVYITQRDRNRKVILTEGHTFLGLVRLNSAVQPKRRGSRND